MKKIKRPQQRGQFKISGASLFSRSSSLSPFYGFVLILLINLVLVLSSVNSSTYRPGPICSSKFIRNNASELTKLRGCRVIEGNLQIGLIEEGEPEHYRNYSFPDLREITGYFLLYRAAGLQSLRYLFPNLAVIRGQNFIYTYALLIHDMPDMYEVGLPSLTNILQRGVYISKNPNLCYVDTVDWDKITNGTSDNIMKKNKPSDQCPNLCPAFCPKSDTDSRLLCWSNEDCQILPAKINDQGQTCYKDGCCSSQCLGGCTDPSPTQCFVCKNVKFESQGESECMSACPSSTFEFLDRRCVTDDECRNITSIEPIVDKGLCVLECPKGYALEKVTRDGKRLNACVLCEGACKKECPATFIDSIEISASLKGCTHINGSLRIQIRGYTANLVQELQSNLDMIEEIDGILSVSNTHSLFSLNFLKSLKTIHGKGETSEEMRYAVIVKSNENIQELWRQNITITNKTASVLFHYNPKLCANKIWEFVANSGINTPKNKMDVGVTNGDKVPCNQRKIKVEIKSIHNNSIVIKWENFRKKMNDHQHLLNYEVYYKASPFRNASIYEDRDPCGNDDWKVLDQPKMDFSGTREAEPEFEDDKIIPGLKSFVQYALYVKTVVIPDETSSNNNTAAESDIVYFVTLPGVPTMPREVTLAPSSSQEIVLSWFPPKYSNGRIEKYQIYMKPQLENREFQEKGDYCGRHSSPIILEHPPTTTVPSFSELLISPNSPECCSCSASPEKQTKTLVANVHIESDVQNAIYNAVYIPNPDYDESAVIDTISDKSNKRRRREIESLPFTNDHHDDSKEIETPKKFPYTVFHGDDQDSIYRDMSLVQEVHVNQTSESGRVKTVSHLSNLTHFTRYTIGITACRASSGENDTKVCSPMRYEIVTTLPSSTADMVHKNNISYNVTGNEVILSWDHPAEPNGLVMSYRINITRVDSSKTNEPSHIECVSYKYFNDNGRTYKFPSILHPGKYSLRIRVISLAPFEANYSSPIYFIIEDTEPRLNTGTLLAIFIPLLIVLCMTVMFILYIMRTRRIVKMITSANPDYLQNINIPEEWEVVRDKVVLVKELGKGSFGMVYEGFVKDFKGQERLKCAVKTVAKDASSEDRKRFLEEALIMTNMSCHHIVLLLGVVSVNQPTYVIMELMALGDLKHYLKSRQPDSPYNIGEPPPTLKQILRMGAEIADGMLYLDSLRYAHRDLAARNCMVAEDRTVKVGDFGMTRDLEETDYYRKCTKGILPVRWMAPESLIHGISNISSDVWSYGVVLWEMATLGARPYEGMQNEEMKVYVEKGGIMERPENCPDILYNMMLRCWQYNPRARPTFADILDWLAPYVDTSFSQVSFYHSPGGMIYRSSLLKRLVPVPEERRTCKTPLLHPSSEDEDEDEHYIGAHNRLLPNSGLNPEIVQETNHQRLSTGTPSPVSSHPSTFMEANTPPSSIPKNNNNSSTSDFTALDINQIDLTNSAQSDSNFHSIPRTIPSSKAKSVPFSVRTFNENPSPKPKYPISGVLDDTTKHLCNGSGPPSGDGRHGVTTPSTSGINGYVTLKQAPDNTQTTQC